VSRFVVSQALLDETFRHFRDCGRGLSECQVLWLSPWEAPATITRVVHGRHRAQAAGVEIDNAWLNSFWLELAQIRHGVRVQVHTHPFEAFHSATDDAFPIVHSAEFLSLVIPDFGGSAPSLENSFLAEISATGDWIEVEPDSRLVIVR
jgi:hypothetical protein